MRVRRATAADVSAIVNLEREATSAAHWPRKRYEQLFLSAPDSPSERCAWIAEDDRDRLADERKQQQPKLLGFLIARRTSRECELENIVVDVNARRTGVGMLLLTELFAYSREARVSSIFLEVRESNRAAQSLYEKSGFEVAGFRKNYYSDPRENAILYRLDLC